MYKIVLKSDFRELFRYNIIITCAGYDHQGEQIYLEGHERIYNETINDKLLFELPPPPDHFVVGDPIEMECGKADKIYSIIYVIANCLPITRPVEDHPPFPMEVTITRSGERIHQAIYEVNQWGGATIHIKK